MIIINADDWGRTAEETDAALACYRDGRITSATAMMFMEDSERAARLAKEHGLSAGLHLNLNLPFTGKPAPDALLRCHARIVRFMQAGKGKFTQVLYNPFLRKQFRYVYDAQVDEFVRLYGEAPTHVDGHQHRHLCTNMILDQVIPKGLKVRRSFSYWPGEKSWIQRRYRSTVDRWLENRYHLTDFFFSLNQCLQAGRMWRVAELARTAKVELMTHPVVEPERKFLLSDQYTEIFGGHQRVSYAAM